MSLAGEKSVDMILTDIVSVIIPVYNVERYYRRIQLLRC